MKKNRTCANPLFEKWLEEWKDYATQKDMSIQYSYAKALSSLRQYPLSLKSGKDCNILSNFGPKLCEMLDKKLKRHREMGFLVPEGVKKMSAIDKTDDDTENSEAQQCRTQNKLVRISEERVSPVPKKIRKIDNQSSRSEQEDDIEKDSLTKESPTKLSKPSESYVPQVGSTDYAILVTLYKKSLEPEYPGFMHKKDIITEAEKDSECRLKTRALHSYVGWSSMKKLVEKSFVARKGALAKFWLTESGLAFVKSIYKSTSDHEKDDDQKINQSISSPICCRSSRSKSSNRSSKGSTNSSSELPNENIIVNLLDNDPDDIFQEDVKEIEGEDVNSYKKVKKKALDKVKSKSSSYSDDDYDKFCEENPEPLVTVKKAEQHFLFKEVLESHSPLNEINSKTDSEDCINTYQKTSEAEENEKIVESSQDKNSVDETPYEPFFLLANNFDIILLVDNQEIHGGKVKPKNDATIKELNKNEVSHEVRSLKVGDFLWIAKCRHTNRELVLPYIIERKRMDDLSSSIKDGRYQEQKFRLHESGIDNVIYMIENYDTYIESSIPLSTLSQAAVNSLIQDDFDVKFTRDHRDSMRYLSTMTKKLTNIYEGKELWSCLKEDLQLNQEGQIKLMEFKEFNEAAVKTKDYDVQEMLIRQLIQLKGVSMDKAAAIVELYPTPKILAKAFREADDKLLENIKSGASKQKVGLSISKTFYQLYTKYDLT